MHVFSGPDPSWEGTLFCGGGGTPRTVQLPPDDLEGGLVDVRS